MKSIKCIKEVKTKTGYTFNIGESYEYAVTPDGFRVWVNSHNSITIKNEETLNKYFDN